MNLEAMIRTIPDYPKPGIMFRDITTLLKDPSGFKHVIDTFYERYKDENLDAIVGIESRGFIVGAALAYKMGLGFVPIRKKGKLPGDVHTHKYDLEYGSDEIEIHQDALEPKAKVVLIDDLLATGGTAMGGKQLLDYFKADILECAFIVDLPDLGGTKKLEAEGLKVFKMIDFAGD